MNVRLTAAFLSAVCGAALPVQGNLRLRVLEEACAGCLHGVLRGIAWPGVQGKQSCMTWSCWGGASTVEVPKVGREQLQNLIQELPNQHHLKQIARLALTW